MVGSTERESGYVQRDVDDGHLGSGEDIGERSGDANPDRTTEAESVLEVREDSDSGRFVLVAGDWHGNDRWALSCLEFAAANGLRHVWHLGDFGIWPGYSGENYVAKVAAACEAYGITLWITPGNHEDYTQIHDPEGVVGERQVLCGSAQWEVALLPRGYTWVHNGKRIVSFGGAPSIDFPARREGKDWWREEMIRESDIERLRKLNVEEFPVDVMLAHDAPDGGTEAVQRIIDIPPHESFWSEAGLAYAREGRILMNEAVEIVKPKMFMHGHFHVWDQRYDPETEQTWVSLGPDGVVQNIVVLDTEKMEVGWIREA